MTTITQDVRDIVGADDNTSWTFYTKEIRLSDAGDAIISTKKDRKYPVAGVLTVVLDPGPAVVLAPDGKTYPFTVPATASELWPLIQAAVTIPPTTTHQQLVDAVNAWLETHPISAIAINVKDSPYNAVGNGSTNDTAAFNAARAAAGVGGHVYVPPGVYIVNSAALSLAHQRWDFAPGAHLKLPAGATNGQIFTVTGDYVTLDGGEWDGNRANVATPVSDGTITIVAAHATVRNAYIHDADGRGILVHPSSTTTTIDGTVVEGCTVVDTFQGGITLDCISYFNVTESSSGVRVSGCWVSNSITPNDAWVGVGVVGSTTDYVLGATVENCYISQPVDGTGLQGGISWRHVTGMSVTGCYVNGTDLAYTFDENTDTVVSACKAYACRVFAIEVAGGDIRTTITGCTVDGAGVTGVGILGDNATNDDLTITGNTIGNLVPAGGKGIYMQTGGRTWTIAGNGIHAAGIGIGIYGAAATNFTIAGNTIEMAAGSTGAFFCGIYLDPVTTGARGWSIRNNNLIGWTTYGIQIEHASPLTASNITVRDNTYTNTGSILTLSNVTLDATCKAENWDGVVAPDTHAATGKTTPVDADELPIVDSAASNVLKKLTFANLKAWFKSYYDSVTTTMTNKTLTDPKINAIKDTNGNTALGLGASASAVNNVKVVNAATGNAVQVLADGSDSTVDLILRPRGNSGGGGFVYITDGAATTVAQFRSSATPVNNWRFYSSDTGQALEMDATGSDTDLSINFIPKGTGRLQENGNNAASWVAVPSTATSTGKQGQMAADASFLYTCYATNSWRRVAHASW